MQATGYYERALALARKIGVRSVETMHSWNLGLCYEQSDPARAIELMLVRVACECETGHVDAQLHAMLMKQIGARPSGCLWLFGRQR